MITETTFTITGTLTRNESTKKEDAAETLRASLERGVADIVMDTIGISDVKVEICE